jgi:hypothetical protein
MLSKMQYDAVFSVFLILHKSYIYFLNASADLIKIFEEPYMGHIVQGKIGRIIRNANGTIKSGFMFSLLFLCLTMSSSCIGDKVTVEIDPAAPGAQIQDDFLGISVEWGSVPDYLGDGSGGLRPAVVTIMRAFEAEDHRLSVRIGGNSQDLAWWNPQGVTPPSGVTINIGPAHLATLAALAEVLQTRLILGLNLAIDDPALAVGLIDAAYDAIPGNAIQAFEMGNEPDLYRTEGPRRGLGYGWNAYLADMEAFHDNIAEQVPPSTPFAATAIANRSWLGNMPGFCEREKNRLALVTTHIYPFTNCYNLAPSAEALLTEYATSGIGASYKTLAAAAHAQGLAYRMDEMNSVSCGGADGVSNVYAAALWGADIAFQLAAAGLDGINFHTPSRYAVFSLDASGVPVVYPLYYGMRFFSLATASHGRLLPLSIKTPARVHAWATLGEDGAVRVALINLNRKTDKVVYLYIPGWSESASLVRLQAPSLTAKTGLTLGGLTWDGSTDGHPLGIASSEPVAYEAGSYKVSLPALEAVVVKVSPAL